MNRNVVLSSPLQHSFIAHHGSEQPRHLGCSHFCNNAAQSRSESIKLQRRKQRTRFSCATHATSRLHAKCKFSSSGNCAYVYNNRHACLLASRPRSYEKLHDLHGCPIDDCTCIRVSKRFHVKVPCKRIQSIVDTIASVSAMTRQIWRSWFDLVHGPQDMARSFELEPRSTTMGLACYTTSEYCFVTLFGKCVDLRYRDSSRVSEATRGLEVSEHC